MAVHENQMVLSAWVQALSPTKSSPAAEELLLNFPKQNKTLINLKTITNTAQPRCRVQRRVRKGCTPPSLSFCLHWVTELSGYSKLS